MTPKISVIMPMYNVEKYVGLAIQSLLDQTFEDFEAIFIDDCGPDKSFEIAKSFDDPRIKVIQNEKNLGATGTRNHGLELATGKYIYFLDSDDAMLPKCLELLYNAAENAQADVATSLISYHAKDSEFQTLKNLKCNTVKYNNGIITKVSDDLKTRIMNEYADRKMHCAVWLSLFKKSLFDGETAEIRFRNFAVADDDYFLCDILCATSKVVKIDKPVYVYRPREGSISKSEDFKRISKYLNAIMDGEDFLKEKLLPLTNDPLFVENVNLKVSQRLFKFFLMNYFKKDPSMVAKEFYETLKNSDKDHSVFFTTMMIGFLQRSVLLDENNNYKTALRIIKTNINKLTNL